VIRLKTVWVALLASFVVFVSQGRAQEGARPNVVFILADDLGWGELGCYGQEKIRTPRLDRSDTFARGDPAKNIFLRARLADGKSRCCDRRHCRAATTVALTSI